MAAILKSIYKKLYTSFGPQDWWPGDTAFEVAVGAILTQNTNWRNVEKAIGNLKKAGLLNPRKMYTVSNRQLAKFIRPAGYYNIKAKRLKSFMDFLMKNHHGDIRKMSSVDLDSLRKQLLSVNGIGPETADSILLYALDKPIFVIDAYTKRILLRHHLIEDDATYDQMQGLFMNSLNREVKLFNEYHALLVRLGKEFCLKNDPRCHICPLGGLLKNNPRT